MNGFAIQLNKNAFGLVPAGPLTVKEPIARGGTDLTELKLTAAAEHDVAKGVVLQIAIKYSPGGVVYFAEKLVETLDTVLVAESGRMDRGSYLKAWASVPDAHEVTYAIRVGADPNLNDVAEVVRRLESARMYVVAKRNVHGADVIYFSGLLLGPSRIVVMAELTLPGTSGAPATLASRSPAGPAAAPFLQALGGTCQRLLQ
jgi:AP-1 complex subunit beta-1